ncbi:MAG: hypothetical protein ACOYES_10745 [Bacillota bacterium]|jgi:hypothetical protein
MIRKIIDAVCPLISNCRMNKKIRRRLAEPDSNEVLCHIGNGDAVDIEVLREQYDNAIRAKDKLEDKAKAIIVAITIAATLIMGAKDITDTIYGKFTSCVLIAVSFCLFIFAVVYMITAGVLAVRVICEDNTVHTIDLRSFASGDTALRNEYRRRIGKNADQNLIRNNSICTSYECIRNALICLFIVLVLAVIPWPASTSRDAPYAEVARGRPILYSSSSVGHIRDENDQALVESIVAEAIRGGLLKESVPTGIVSEENRLFIKAVLEKGMIKVVLIEAFAAKMP